MADELHQSVPESAEKFAFGRNWQNFSGHLTPERIENARGSISTILGTAQLSGQTFLDAGSGSGLFSLVAWQLGASVTSFDADPDSVACTRSLKQKHADASENWSVLDGSLLDHKFVSQLGCFDTVYCWGVAHHTGHMWDALAALAKAVAEDGLLVVAIYNDQGFSSRIWTVIKRLYNWTPRLLQPAYAACVGGVLFAFRLATTILAMSLRIFRLKNPMVPLNRWYRERPQRGMSWWHDLVDWVGGWPFEVARPCEIFTFFRDRGFTLVRMETTPGSGCNEFVFRRANDR